MLFWFEEGTSLIFPHVSERWICLYNWSVGYPSWTLKMVVSFMLYLCGFSSELEWYSALYATATHSRYGGPWHQLLSVCLKDSDTNLCYIRRPTLSMFCLYMLTRDPPLYKKYITWDTSVCNLLQVLWVDTGGCLPAEAISEEDTLLVPPVSVGIA